MGYARKLSRPAGRRLAALGGAILLAACHSSQPMSTAPQSTAGSGADADRVPAGARAGFYPLTPGNEWIYDGTIFTRVEGDPHAQLTWYGQKRQVVGAHEVAGRTYVAERLLQWSKLTPFPPADSGEFWVYYRQDRAGLYESDHKSAQTQSRRLRAWLGDQEQWVAAAPAHRHEAYRQLAQRTGRKLRVLEAALGAGTATAPRRMGPPGGGEPGELTRLAYPLHPRQHWVIRDVPRFTSTVEAHDVFRLEPGRFEGYRIAIESELFEPHDRVEVWYSREGFLALRAHFETLYTDYTDPYGTDSLRQITDELLTLQHLHLHRR